MIQRNFSQSTIRYDLLKRENIKGVHEFMRKQAPLKKMESLGKSRLFEEGQFTSEEEFR